MAKDVCKRFVSVNEEYLKDLIEDADSKSTKNIIKSSVNIFEEYLKENNIEIDLWNQQNVASILEKFWPSLRKQDNSPYSKKSLQTTKYGLKRHFSKFGYDINDDIVFQKSNVVFNALLKKMKKEGLCDVKHKQPLESNDIKTLYNAFDLESPKGLQHKVFTDIMIYLCNRGRENLRQFTLDDFSLETDSIGLVYLRFARHRLTKNHQGNDDAEDKSPRMYEFKGPDGERNHLCPIASYEKYIGKLNKDCTAFWQRPRQNVATDDSTWYCDSPLGKNTLGNMMKTLSSLYNLSKLYTNHCLRATTITSLDSMGFASRHIMVVSGQKSEQTIKNYSHTDEGTKRDMSHGLSSLITGHSSARPVLPSLSAQGPSDVSMAIARSTSTSGISDLASVMDIDENSFKGISLSQENRILNEITQRNTALNINNSTVTINYNFGK